MPDDRVPPRSGLPRAIEIDRLRAAVSSQRSWRGVMRELGFTGSRTGRVLREICGELGIDYSHFRLLGPDDQLIAGVVPAARTWPEALEQLGYVSASGSARATLRKHCQRLGIDTAHLRLEVDNAASPVGDQTPALDRLRVAGPYLVATMLTLLGYSVSLAAEGAPYDLVVDDGRLGLSRVQVKTTTRRAGSSWNCKLTRSEYRRDTVGGHGRANYCAEDIDHFACVDGDGDVYLIPISFVEGKTCISLKRYAHYRLPLRLVGLPGK